MRRLLFLAIFAATPLAAQIQDNSFLVEEAYNQEAGVVQHISFFQHPTHSGEWVSSFTQEWPAGGIKNQLSYTLTSARVFENRGFGDVALNYRYQLVGDGEARLAFSPRVSVVLPTGEKDRGLGTGAVGIQFMLPVSTVLCAHVVAHWNAGASFTPGDDSRSWLAANSVVWLVHPRFNVLVETVWSRNDTRGGGRENNLIVSPGIRWSYDRPGHLQIVPGLAFPISLRGLAERGVIAYLSFEHPFKRNSK